MHESNTFIKKTTHVENFMNPHYGDFIQGKDIVEHFKGTKLIVYKMIYISL